MSYLYFFATIIVLENDYQSTIRNHTGRSEALTLMSSPEGTAQRFIEVALDEVGYIEKPENLTKYGEYTKANGLPWCGSFVNWCAHQAGVKLPA